MVDHPVRKGGGANQPAFGFVDIEVRIGAGAVRLFLQLLGQTQQIMLQIEFKVGHRGPAAFALAGGTEGAVERIKAIDIGVEMPVALHKPGVPSH